MTPRRDLNVLTLKKGEETYVFAYDDDSRADCLRTLGQFASRPDISFTWYDAACLSQKIREEKSRPRSRIFNV